MTGAEGAVARAVALGSEDAALHFLDGQIMLQKHYMEDEWPDRALDADTARAIADRLAKSLTIHPRNRDAIQSFSIALMCVPELTDRDLALLGVALRLYPDNGLPLVVRAAAANRRGDFQTARRLLAEARTEPYSLPPPLRPAATAMGERWLLDQVSESLQDVGRIEQLDAVEALIATELAAEGTSPSLAKRLESIQADLTSFRRHLQAAEAVERGDLDQASSLYREILADPDASRTSRRQAERALETLENDQRSAESR
jgi:hypothetical protein